MAISRFKTSTLAQGLPKYQDVWDGTTALFDSDFELIERTTAGSGGLSTISFTSIPSTYRHLQVRFIAAGTGTPALSMRINSDSGANYVRHRLQGNGATAIMTTDTANELNIFGSPGLTTASTFNAGVIDILDYANTNKNTTVRLLAGVDNNGSGNIEFTYSLWLNTAAVTGLSFTPTSGNLSQYSSFALYGIKGAA